MRTSVTGTPTSRLARVSGARLRMFGACPWRQSSARSASRPRAWMLPQSSDSPSPRRVPSTWKASRHCQRPSITRSPARVVSGSPRLIAGTSGERPCSVPLSPVPPWRPRMDSRVPHWSTERSAWKAAPLSRALPVTGGRVQRSATRPSARTSRAPVGPPSPITSGSLTRRVSGLTRRVPLTVPPTDSRLPASRLRLSPQRQRPSAVTGPP